MTAKSLLASRPETGSRVEPQERWNLLGRDVLNWCGIALDRVSFLRSVQESRYMFELEALELAVVRQSDEEMATISTACREMDAAVMLSEHTAADTRFHIAILRSARNELLMPRGALGRGEDLRFSPEDHVYCSDGDESH